MDRERWDWTLLELGGPLMQTWQWGEYKRGHCWRIERVYVRTPDGTAMAQVLFRHVGPTSFAYVPHGPAIAGDGPAVFGRLVAALDAVCRRHRAATLVLEPARPLPLTGSYKAAGFVRGPSHIQVVETLKVLLGSDEQLLARMRKKTRYGVRLGQRRGVTVRRTTIGDADAFSTFYALVGETAKRHGFPVRPRAYYEEVMRLFQGDAALLLASVDGEAVAGELVVAFGEEANSLYAGSSTSKRVNGATAYLEFEVLRWARDHGCRRLDLWGTDWVGMPDDGAAWFKLGFGGEMVVYPPTLERRYRPIQSWLMRRALAAYHSRVT
jgi:lipid II:glycine glycyltransferase (peptidoglycan interpeptide bridge formation enzyme)